MKKILFFLYVTFLVLFTIFSYAFVDPNLFYLKSIYTGLAFSDRLLYTIFYTLSIAIFFIFYGIFVYSGIKKKISVNDFLILLGITVFILIFSYPAMLSYDIFNYFLTSKVLFFYHENPYVIMPIEFNGESLLAFTHAANKLALYGPVWILLTGIPYLIGFGNFLLTLFSFKLFVTIFYLLTIFLIWRISKNIVTLILFSLNPLVVIETLISGHNDIVMMCFALLSIILLQKKKYLFAFSFLMLSILIKYSTIFLIPVFIYMFYLKIKEKSLDLNKIYLGFVISMGIIFLLSPLREELYSWYAIWFIVFVFLTKNKDFKYVSILISLGLLLGYVPYMFLGNYFGITPFLKTFLIFVLPVIYLIIYFGIFLNKVFIKNR